MRLAIAAMVLMGLAAVGFGGTAASAADEPASLIIDVYTCDAHNDPIDPNQTLVNECNLGTEDIAFTLEPAAPRSGSASASTGTGGSPSTISFTGLASGDYRLAQQMPESIALSYISQCASNLRTFDYPFSPFAIIEPGGRLNVQLLPGEQLTCDWYNIHAPPDQAPVSAALTITAYSCDGDVIGPGMCDLAPNVTFTITDTSGNTEQLTTGSDGTVTFDSSGTYQLTPTSELPNRNFCAFEPYGSVSISDGALTLDPANPIAIDAYYCYPGA